MKLRIMGFLYKELELGGNIVTQCKGAFEGVNLNASRPEIFHDPRTVEAIKFCLELEDFVSNEIFRAYPTADPENCRHITREETLNLSEDDFEIAVEGFDAPYFFDLFKESNSVPTRLLSDMVSFKMLELTKDTMKVELKFLVPRSMSQQGWLLVYREEEEVFG